MRSLVLIAVFAASHAQAKELYLASRTLPTSSSPESVTIADLNADGRPDVITADSGSGRLTIYYASADGFAAPATLNVGAGAFEARVADLNSDALPDLVVARIGSFGGGGSVAVRLATSPGVFAPETVIASGDTPVALDVADLNADGFLDIVAADSGFSGGGDELFVVLAIGAGAFAPPVRYPAGDYPSDVVATDLNADGRVDLVVANAASGSAGVFYGVSSGVFAPMQIFPAGSGPRGVAVADVNGDARPDLATANGIGSADASLLLASGPAFAPEQRLAVGSFPTSVVLVDLDADGAVDLVTANRSTADVSVRFGDGAGAFAPAQSIPAGAGANFVASGDLNRDGRPDLAVANVGSDSLTLLLSTTPDRTDDGVVDAHDLASLLSEWGRGGADLNADGTTNADDLALLLDAWGPLAPK